MRIQYKPELPEVSADHQEIYDDILEAGPALYSGTVHTGVGYHKIDGRRPEVSQWLKAGRRNQHGIRYRSFSSSMRRTARRVNGRYDWIEKITRAAVSRFKMGQVVLTDRIDHILTRPIFGIPVLLAVMAFVFFLTYAVGVSSARMAERSDSAFH